MTALSDATGLGPAAIALTLAVVFASGVLRGLTGFGFAIVATPLLSIVAEPRLAVATCVLLQVAIGLLDAPSAWPQARGQPLGRLLLGAAVATPLGMLVLGATPAGPQRLIIGAATLIALAAVWRGRERPIAAITGRPGAVGLASGLLNGLAAMPGPPVVMYFLTAPIPDATARAALIVYFAFAAVVAAGTGLATGVIGLPAGAMAAAGLPGLIAGTRLGAALFARGDARVFRAAGLATLALAAAAAMIKALAGPTHG